MYSTIRSITSMLSEQVIHTELRLRVLEDLLIKKEIITAKELEELYSIVSDRDFDKLKFDLAESLRGYIELYEDQE